MPSILAQHQGCKAIAGDEQYFIFRQVVRSGEKPKVKREPDLLQRKLKNLFGALSRCRSPDKLSGKTLLVLALILTAPEKSAVPRRSDIRADKWCLLCC
jgi:hypothetical protein